MAKDLKRQGRTSRNKGKRGEREVVILLREAGFPAAHRSVQYCGRTGTAADVIGLPGIHIEVKYVEREAVRSWYSQAARDAGAGGRGDIPVVFHRKSRAPWLVTLGAEDFLRLLSKGGE